VPKRASTAFLLITGVALTPHKFPEGHRRCKAIRARMLDADYWLNDANENAAPAFLQPMFEGDRASLKPYIDGSRFPPVRPTSSAA
jgi:hypothetical protein